MQRFAFCNETFGPDRSGWERVCRCLAAVGYDGVEIAPFTFGPSVTDISATRRREIRAVAEDHGLVPMQSGSACTGSWRRLPASTSTPAIRPCASGRRMLYGHWCTSRATWERG